MTRGNPQALKAWRQACKESGYLTPGTFKKMPKKGTAGYRKIKKRYLELKKKGTSSFGFW